MEPLNPAAHGSASQRGLMVVLGVWTLLLVLCTAGGLFVVKRRYDGARRGWNLVPVVVVAVDLERGAPVTMDVISQRSVPEQFVTDSVVKPDEAGKVINQRVRAKLLAGDPLLWRDLEPPAP